MKTTVKKNEAKSQAKATDVKIEAKVAPQQTAPVASAAPKAGPEIGQADLTSKRLSQVALTEYRIVPSQRKSFKGYFIQGGTMHHDASSLAFADPPDFSAKSVRVVGVSVAVSIKRFRARV